LRMNRYLVACTINYRNGIWTGPHRATIEGRTMTSAWDAYKRTIIASDVAYLSIIQWHSVGVPYKRRHERE
jgi:hypothetical protein